MRRDIQQLMTPIFNILFYLNHC